MSLQISTRQVCANLQAILCHFGFRAWICGLSNGNRAWRSPPSIQVMSAADEFLLLCMTCGDSALLRSLGQEKSSVTLRWRPATDAKQVESGVLTGYGNMSCRVFNFFCRTSFSVAPEFVKGNKKSIKNITSSTLAAFSSSKTDGTVP